MSVGLSAGAQQNGESSGSSGQLDSSKAEQAGVSPNQEEAAFSSAWYHWVTELSEPFGKTTSMRVKDVYDDVSVRGSDYFGVHRSVLDSDENCSPSP